MRVCEQCMTTTTSRENKKARMAVAVTTNMAANSLTTTVPKMAGSPRMATAASVGSHLSPEEEAATRRFLENVNKWRAANNLTQVTSVVDPDPELLPGSGSGKIVPDSEKYERADK